jgi:hypothetical protein
MGKLGRLKRGITPDKPHAELKMNQQACSCGCKVFTVFNDGKDVMIISCAMCFKGLKFTSHGNVEVTPVKDVKPIG